MNDLEAFRATVEHRRGRILFHASFVPDLKRRVVEHIGTEDFGQYFGMSWGAGVGMKWPEGLAGPDYSRYWENETLPEGTTINGDGVAMVPSGFYHFWGYVSPLRNATSLAELESYPFVDQSGWDCSHMAPAVERAHAAGQYTVVWVGHMYETAWQIRGYEPFLMDMIERPAWAEAMLDREFRNDLVRATAYARAGVDMIHCGDDVANQNAMMFNPDTWRSMMLSRWRQVWQAAKEIHPGIKIWYHSDGNIEAIVPDLIEAGVDILNPVQPECLDLDRLYRRFGERVCFDGCIGTQTTMPFGTPEEVRARVKEVIAKYGQRGGLFVSPTHVLEPDVPIANIEAFADACREFGREP